MSGSEYLPGGHWPALRAAVLRGGTPLRTRQAQLWGRLLRPNDVTPLGVLLTLRAPRGRLRKLRHQIRTISAPMSHSRPSTRARDCMFLTISQVHVHYGPSKASRLCRLSHVWSATGL